jgi:predicted phosphodiesterase
MQIRLLSDLHLEFSDYRYDHIWAPVEEDREQILILAGDIGVGLAAKYFILHLCQYFKHVLFICGNHEFYHNDHPKVIADWNQFEQEQAPKNFHFLNNDWRILDGVRFLGGTMWTNFNGADPIDMFAAHRMMNDFAEIRCEGQRITPHYVVREHDRFMDFLLKKFNEEFDGKTVVISHHSPGNALKRQGHNRDKLASAYYADIEEIIGHYNKADLWVHGHTHRSWNYLVNETTVLCNPYGYYGESTNPNFDPKLVLEI